MTANIGHNRGDAAIRVEVRLFNSIAATSAARDSGVNNPSTTQTARSARQRSIRATVLELEDSASE
ncbi:MAG: hypothetical protein VYA71_00630 [Pseudomonadota bacterium]|nr:hypothetical protein [Pseudomonadota bacterium]